ncbi:hypothetical protein M086_3490, partial [Bacteroides fragilis str. S13 L11]
MSRIISSGRQFIFSKRKMVTGKDRITSYAVDR